MKNRFYLLIIIFLTVGLFTNDAFAQPSKVLNVDAPIGPTKANYVNGFGPNNPAVATPMTTIVSADQLAYSAQYAGLTFVEPDPLKLNIKPEVPLVAAGLSPARNMFEAKTLPSSRQSMAVPHVGCESGDQAVSGGFIPPDPHGTVGTNHALMVNNVAIQGFSKDCVESGDLALQSLQSFFGLATSSFDPKARWDQFESRFVVVTLEKVNGAGNPSAGNHSRIIVGASPVGTLAGAWNSVAIDAKLLNGAVEKWCDYPGFGIDEEAIYVTCNYFDFPGAASGFFTRQFVLNKTTLYAGTFNPVTDLFVYDLATDTANPCNSTHQPAHMLTNPGGTIGNYFTAYSSCSFGGVGGDEVTPIMTLNNPLAALPPTSSLVFTLPGDISDVGGVFGFPPLTDMPQSGTATTVESNDPRALDSIYLNGDMFVTATFMPNLAAGSAGDVGETTAIVFEYDMSAGAPATTLRNIIVGGDNIDAGMFTTFPSVSANANTVAIGVAASSSSHFVGAYYALFNRTTTTLGPLEVMREGRDTYFQDFGSGRNRWGDYTSVAADPTDSSFWIFNEYAQETAGTGAWGQYIVQVAAAAPAGPANDDIASAQLVNTTPFAVTVNTNGADSEASESQPMCTVAGNDSGNSIWFTYTPGIAGNADFSVTGGGDYVLSYYTGAAHPLTGVGCADDNGHGGGESLLTQAVTGGTTYLIRIAEYGMAPSAAERADGNSGSVSSSAFSEVGLNVLGPPPTSLPVELVSFNAEVQGTDVMLRWTTATETNNAGFEIQRLAGDGEAFEILGFVDGNGTTVEAMNYNFMIDGETPGTQVYRLKQVDFDGSVFFSASIESQVEVPNGIWLGAAYPNPFNPRTKFSVVVDENQEVKIEVFDYLGKSVALLYEGSLSAGQAHEFRLDADNLTSGTYLYRVTGSKSASLTKSVVLMK